MQIITKEVSEDPKTFLDSADNMHIYCYWIE